MKNLILLFIVIFTAVFAHANVQRSFNYQDCKKANPVLVTPAQYGDFLRGEELKLNYYADKDATRIAEARDGNIEVLAKWLNEVNKDSKGGLWVDASGSPANIELGDVSQIWDTLIARNAISLEPVYGTVSPFSMEFTNAGKRTGKYGINPRNVYPNEMRYVLNVRSKKYKGPSAFCANPFPDMLGLENLATSSTTTTTDDATATLSSEEMEMIKQIVKDALAANGTTGSPNININIPIVKVGDVKAEANNYGSSSGSGGSGFKFKKEFIDANWQRFSYDDESEDDHVIIKEKTIIKEVPVESKSTGLSDVQFATIEKLLRKQLRLQRTDLALGIITGFGNMGLNIYNTVQLNRLKMCYQEFGYDFPDMGGTVGPMGSGTVGPEFGG